MATGDPAIDAAFSSVSADTSSHPVTGDEAIDTAFNGNSSSQTSQPEVTYDANLFRKRVGRDPSPTELANFKQFKGVGFAGDPTQGKFTAGQAAVGGVEDALSLGTGTILGVPAAAGGYLYGLTGANGSDSLSAARAARNAVTYQPRTEAGQAGLETLGQIKPGEIAPRLLDVAGAPNAAQTVREVEERTGDVAPLLGEAAAGFPVTRATAGGIAKVVPAMDDPEAPTNVVSRQAQAALDKTTAESQQSMGAAQAVPPASSLPPALQKAVVAHAQRTGGAINPEALTNHAEAMQHGVQLMEGQATRDPILYSNEQNSVDPKIRARINKQEDQLTDAIDDVRREAGPATVGNNPIQNGQIAVDSLKSYDVPVKADIKGRYKALIDANGGTVPIDTSSFLQNVDAQLKKQYLTDSVPSQGTAILNSLRRDEPMDFEGFEAARSRLAEAQREGGSGGVAAGIIRNQLEQLPLSPAAASLKGLADSARSAAKARFDAMEADPAYEAAVNDTAKIGAPSPLADKFLDKYALNAPKANLDLMMQKLDEGGQEAVASHTLSTMRKAAIGNTGEVMPNGYAGFMQKYGPKLDSLVKPDTAESLDSLGRVIHNAKVAPPGDVVNYSKSGVIMNAAQGAGESFVNAKTAGLGIPIIKRLVSSRDVKRTLEPGAGLSRLSDVVNRP